MSKRQLVALSIALSCSAFASAPSTAADLGGNCCADLEERIAELEATTARKGNRKVSLTISGQVNTLVLFYDDGTEKNAYVTDNNNSSTRFRFLGSAKIDANWSAGYLIEVETISAASNVVTQNNDDGNPNAINVRHSAWYIDHKQLGRVWVGQTSPATDDIILADAAGAGLLAFSDPLTGNALFFRRTGSGAATGFTPGSIAPNIDTSRRNIVRYDTPIFQGFQLRASYGEDDFWDVGLWYAGQVAGFTIVGGVGYLMDTEGNAFNGVPPAAPAVANIGPNFNEFKGSISVLHDASGLFGDFAFVHREFDSVDRTPAGGNRLRPDLEYYYFRGGVVAKNLVPVGKTVFYGEYGRADGGSEQTLAATTGGVTGIITNSEFNFWGVGVVQHIPAAGVELYAGYKKLDANVATSTLGKIATDEIDTVGVGARVKF